MIPSTRLRVLFDASLAGNPAGTGTYVRGLQAALLARPDLEIIPVRFEADSTRTLDTGAKGVVGRAASMLGHLTYYLHELPRLARRSGCDLVYCPSSLVPARGRTPMLMTVFDLTPLTHASTQDRVSREYLAAMLRVGIRRASSVVTISHAVADEIRDRFPRVGPSGVYVTYPGPNPELTGAEPQPVSGLDRPFVLMVGTVEPRKNHLTALRALAEHLRKSPTSSLTLIVAGSAGWRYEPVRGAVNELGLRDRVIFVGGIDPGQLKWLYQHARGLLFPSLYEGFGLPVLEAMMFGCPVVASRIPSVVEIAADTALLLEPTDVAAWAAAIGKLEQGGAGVEAALERSRRFTWENCAESAVAAIRATAGRL